MAQLIPMESSRRDKLEEAFERLQQAPAQHSEALLAALEVIQGLHDQGVFELLRGVLGGGGRILEIIVDAAKKPVAIRGMRNLLIILKVPGSIDPEELKEVVGVIPDLLSVAAKSPRNRASESLARRPETLRHEHSSWPCLGERCA